MGERYPTSTRLPDNRCVPWLAAEGPLSYTPENPPDRDYFFQYSWILPEIFSPEVNRREHFHFGSCGRDSADELFRFWNAARNYKAQPIAGFLGTFSPEEVRAPIAIYGHRLAYSDSDGLMFIQHGSYQWIASADQPWIATGHVLLYRGVGRTRRVRLPRPSSTRSPEVRRAWDAYLAVQAQTLSDSVLSFLTIHDRTARCETNHLRDRTCQLDDVARAHGLDLERGFTKPLWNFATRSFSLVRWVAERKFGPHFFWCRTPVWNIRLTTFFAGEHEVRVIDPTAVDVVGAVGCDVA